MSSRFDQQAAAFDERASVPDEVARSVARELARLASLSSERLVVDVGAGTGTVGRFVAESAVRYVGLDLSLPMLRVFASRLRQRPQSQPSTLLVMADANRTWPLAAGSAAVVFFSRSLHLLAGEHTVTESLRVMGSKQAVIAVGRVRRSPRSGRAMLRAELLSRLASRAIATSRGEEASSRLVEGLKGRGCRIVEADRIVVARWTAEETLGASLDTWRRQPGLAGVPIADGTKQVILEDLECWAKRRFGALDASMISDEQYELNLFELDARAKA